MWKMDLHTASKRGSRTYGPGKGIEVPDELAATLYERRGEPVPEALAKRLKEQKTVKITLEYNHLLAGYSVGPGEVDVTEDAAKFLAGEEAKKKAAGEAKPSAGTAPAGGAETGTSSAEGGAAGAGAGTGEGESESTVSGRKSVSSIGLDDALAQKLSDGGFKTVASVRSASDEDLKALGGIGSATLKKIRDATK